MINKPGDVNQRQEMKEEIERFLSKAYADEIQ